MTKIKLPEPVAFRWRVPIVDSDGRQLGEGDWKFGTEKGGRPWWTRDNLITTTQAEAYADAKVRVALEEAAKMVLECDPRANHRGIAIAIRAIIPPTE